MNEPDEATKAAWACGGATVAEMRAIIVAYAARQAEAASRVMREEAAHYLDDRSYYETADCIRALPLPSGGGEWECTNERTVEWNAEQTKHLRERLASSGGGEPAISQEATRKLRAIAARSAPELQRSGGGDVAELVAALETIINDYDSETSAAIAESLAKYKGAKP